MPVGAMGSVGAGPTSAKVVIPRTSIHPFGRHLVDDKLSLLSNHCC